MSNLERMGGKSVVQYGDQCANCKTYYNLANCDFGSRYSQFLLADIYRYRSGRNACKKDYIVRHRIANPSNES